MKVSEQDELFYRLAREHISAFRNRLICLTTDRVLEIAPEHDRPWPNADTMNITAGCTFQHDITKLCHRIADSTYDIVFCMEVLEHTVDPFAALREIRRILLPNGLLLASAPFNFREHHPRPDCWRFSRNGWTVLLKDWDFVQQDVLMTPDRFLMPLHINVSARCNKTKDVDASTLAWADETT